MMDVMKPIISETVPTGDEWLYEIKYDGFRCRLVWTQETVTLLSKNNHDLNERFPEVVEWCKSNVQHVKDYLPVEIDGELVVLNHRYQANFNLMQTRGRMRSAERIQERAKLRPATLMAFDLTRYAGVEIRDLPLEKRKKRLGTITNCIPNDDRFCVVETFTELSVIEKFVFDYQCEGLVAKKKASVYQKGKQHHDWLKIKNWRVIQGIITQYNPSNGYFAVQAYEDQGSSLITIGKCKHGLPSESSSMLHELFHKKGEEQNGEYLLPPAVVGKIRTLGVASGEMREPEFERIEPSVQVKNCTVSQVELDLAQFPTGVHIKNLQKELWPRLSKKDLLIYMRRISPYMLPFLKDKVLTIIRAPDGVAKETFFQKQIPDYAPLDLLETTESNEIVCNRLEGLLWLANHGSIEYHVPFQRVCCEQPNEIVFDLDPPNRNHFYLAIHAAQLLKRILDDLDLISFVKTSGNKGLQVFIPIKEGSVTYEETALITEGIANILVEAHPDNFTTERLKKNRNEQLYVDYVQHGKDKTLIAPYSPRLQIEGTISTPLYWHELTEDLDPTNYTLSNVVTRVLDIGCPFATYSAAREQQRMEPLLRLVK
ncbi:DNA ligase D [Geomicrobium sediminis]|uniref:DNA ligase (ATP) n=1 Tax=Geomicrobium sediminis TaxID=1347788 RepID=A0ABS2PGQ8_9BACL|nr:DNA ligase D [Geomicrobium sediminis]MBM7634627.1 bifunctional non-homologous end joining protein LigD [Geomicrobium sediminis]